MNNAVAALEDFDAYNSQDPNREMWGGKEYPKELLYAMRMSGRLNEFAPDSPEYLTLAARCQHIGRWEIPRSAYPMNRKGYLQWRSMLKLHHAKIAGDILAKNGYTSETIEKVKFLLLKKELNQNADTQLLEDVICLVFVQYYLDDFAAAHKEEKVIDILRKTMNKMSSSAITEVSSLPLSDKILALIGQAAAT
ncbi:MAG: DUF4202 domain-containing protein [Chryseolinea sp.]